MTHRPSPERQPSALRVLAFEQPDRAPVLETAPDQPGPLTELDIPQPTSVLALPLPVPEQEGPNAPADRPLSRQGSCAKLALIVFNI
jgi:hypothetical protein